ncbi:MAG TPA: DNA translocase FtsK 4TM domain-containing protein, partial [Gemmatimonadaceae bacterium]|nr:DNA translocase FtsK 4TM domain-containing protein [Gemmatimonadaceae bacterium]
MGRDTLRRELAGAALALLAVFLLASIALEKPVLAHSGCVESRGLFGPIGSCLRDVTVSFLGLPAAVLLAIALGVVAARLLGRDLPGDERRWGAFVGGMVLLLPIVLATALGSGDGEHPATGLLGGGVYSGLRAAVGVAGAWVVMVAAFSALTIVTLAWNPVRMVIGPSPARAERQPDERMNRGGQYGLVEDDLEPAPEELPGIDSSAPFGDEPEQRELPLTGKRDRKKGGASRREDKIAAEFDAHDHGGEGDWGKPPIDLLTLPPAPDPELHDRELDAMGDKLKDALRTFRVDAEIVGRTTGP